MRSVLVQSGLAIALGAGSAALAQTPAPAASQPCQAGQPLKTTPNVKVYGSFRFSESLAYDADRDLYLSVHAGMPQEMAPNDGYVSLINPDGTVHTLKWIGVDRHGLALNHPLGSDIANGMLYVVDIDTVRWFDMKTGEPKGQVQVPGVIRFNDLEVAADGTIYATQTGTPQAATSWKVYKVTPQGQSSVVVTGAPLNMPNGIAFDAKGNLVVVNIGTNDVHTFTPDGKFVTTEQAVDSGNDGIVVTADGTKYVSSVRQGTVSRIRPGQKAEIVASGIPSAASMTYDSKRNRLVIPMNDWNAIAIVELNAK
ncbi:MAG: SMP-30/gluconolactonase/LRE family protein [Acidobacteria bacterium]|nr:SMP-30/gluconolactonase/LRE family protein [Acidobacteriota bacterium]